MSVIRRSLMAILLPILLLTQGCDKSASPLVQVPAHRPVEDLFAAGKESNDRTASYVMYFDNWLFEPGVRNDDLRGISSNGMLSSAEYKWRTLDWTHSVAISTFVFDSNQAAHSWWEEWSMKNQTNTRNFEWICDLSLSASQETELYLVHRNVVLYCKQKGDGDLKAFVRRFLLKPGIVRYTDLDQKIRPGLNEPTLVAMLGEPTRRSNREAVRNRSTSRILEGDVLYYLMVPDENTSYHYWIRLDRGVVVEHYFYEEGTCIGSGTMIETESGPRDITTIRVGDHVIGYDTQSGHHTNNVVLRIHTSESSKTLLFGKSLRVTPSHPLFADSEYVPAFDVKPADGLLTIDGLIQPAGQFVLVDEEVPVFDLEVGGTHNFFAGGFLVHNKRLGP